MTSNDDDHISDAVEDSYGRRYLCFGAGSRSVWIAVGDLSTFDRATVERLNYAGVPAISAKAKEGIKIAAQSVADYRKVAIASAPGWTGDVYILRDGRIIAPSKASVLPIVAFDPDPRFAPSSSFAEWQSAIAPMVQCQPLLLFGLAFSLVGPLLRFAPSNVQNVMFEIVGAPNVGKSTLAKLMSSVWGGCPDSLLGTCVSWDFSPAKLDGLRSDFRDGLLVLDEAAKAGRNEGERAEVIGNAMFKLSDTSSRHRFGESALPAVRQAILSTSNISMRDLIGNATQTHVASVSRAVTVMCDRAFGVLDTVPAGFESARRAIEALDSSATRHSGSAGPEFLERLCRYRHEGIKRAIESGMAVAARRGVSDDAMAPRAAKVFAMTYAVGCIARQLGILPREWGRLDEAFRAVREPDITSSNLAPNEPAVFSIKGFLLNHKDRLLSLDDDRLPLTGDQFENTAGVWIERGRRILIPTKYLQKHLNGHQQILQELKHRNRLDFEGGCLSKKAPRAVSKSGRAYYIDVS